MDCVEFVTLTGMRLIFTLVDHVDAPSSESDSFPGLCEILRLVALQTHQVETFLKEMYNDMMQDGLWQGILHVRITSTAAISGFSSGNM